MGQIRAKDVDFLNKHIEGFQAISLIKKIQRLKEEYNSLMISLLEFLILFQ